MVKEKCLVVEARDKCQCSWCKQSRECCDIALKNSIWLEENGILSDALNEIEENVFGVKT